jgi:hypothetical protein
MSPAKENLSSPEYQVNDFNLDLNESVGMSEVDEESERSVFFNRQRTTNISVSGQLLNLDQNEDLKGDNENRFNINIHEIQTESEDVSN